MKYLNLLFLFIILIGFITTLNTCKKDELVKVTKLEIGSESNITETTASVTARFIDVSSKVTSYGFCYNTSSNPIITDSAIIISGIAKKGEYSSILTALTSNTKYFVRAYAMEGNKVIYSSKEISFTTIAYKLPTVTTNAPTEITSNFAISGGYVSSDGGSAVTDCGVCWSLSENPAIEDYSVSSSTGIGTYTSNLTGLSNNTQYYVRAYAINSIGTAYGNQQSFTTQAPFIEISSPVASSSWQVGTPHSIEWNHNISGNIKIELFIGLTYLQEIAISNSNEDSYSWNIPILAQSDIYKIKISSVDNASTYDESEQFTIIAPSGSTSTLSDYDDNIYNAIKIGNQWWMAENLKVTHYPNGDEITMVAGDANWIALSENSKAFCYYNDNTGGEMETYGALYTWAAAMNGAVSTNANPSGISGVCPTGWHLPSDDEWKQLEVYLGMSQSQADNINWRGSDQGGRLKESSIIHWDTPNTGANNLSGFTGLPGGFRTDDIGNSVQLRNGGLWWSTTQYDGTTAWYRHLQHVRETVGRWYNNKSRGFSVRCINN